MPENDDKHQNAASVQESPPAIQAAPHANVPNAEAGAESGPGISYARPVHFSAVSDGELVQRGKPVPLRYDPTPEELQKIEAFSGAVDTAAARTGVNPSAIIVERGNDPFFTRGDRIGISFDALREEQYADPSGPFKIRHEMKHVLNGDSWNQNNSQAVHKAVGQMSDLSHDIANRPGATYNSIIDRFGSLDNFENFLRNVHSEMAPVLDAVNKHADILSLESPDAVKKYFAAHPESDTAISATLENIPKRTLNMMNTLDQPVNGLRNHVPAENTGETRTQRSARESAAEAALPEDVRQRLLKLNEEYLAPYSALEPQLDNFKRNVNHIQELGADRFALRTSDNPRRDIEAITNEREGAGASHTHPSDSTRIETLQATAAGMENGTVANGPAGIPRAEPAGHARTPQQVSNPVTGKPAIHILKEDRMPTPPPSNTVATHDTLPIRVVDGAHRDSKGYPKTVPFETLTPEQQAKAKEFSAIVTRDQQRMDVHVDAVTIDVSAYRDFSAANDGNGRREVNIGLQSLNEREYANSYGDFAIPHEIRHLKFDDTNVMNKFRWSQQLSAKLSDISQLTRDNPEKANEYIQKNFGSMEAFEEYTKRANQAIEPAMAAYNDPNFPKNRTPEEVADYFSKHPEAEEKFKNNLNKIQGEDIRELGARIKDFPKAGSADAKIPSRSSALTTEESQKLQHINENYLKPNIDSSAHLKKAVVTAGRANEFLADEGAIMAAPDPAHAVAELRGPQFYDVTFRSPDDSFVHPSYQDRIARAEKVAQRTEAMHAIERQYPEAMTFDRETGRAHIDTAKIPDKNIIAPLTEWSPPDAHGVLTIHSPDVVKTEKPQSPPLSTAPENTRDREKNTSENGDIPARPIEPSREGGPRPVADVIHASKTSHVDPAVEAGASGYLTYSGIMQAGRGVGEYQAGDKAKGAVDIAMGSANAGVGIAGGVETVAPGTVEKYAGRVVAENLEHGAYALMAVQAGYEIASAAPGEKGLAAYKVTGSMAPAVAFMGEAGASGFLMPAAAGMIGDMAVERDIALRDLTGKHDAAMAAITPDSAHTHLQGQADKLQQTLMLAQSGDRYAMDASGKIDITNKANLDRMKAAMPPEAQRKLESDSSKAADTQFERMQLAAIDPNTGLDTYGSKSAKEIADIKAGLAADAEKQALQNGLAGMESARQARHDYFPADAKLALNQEGKIDLTNKENLQVMREVLGRQHDAVTATTLNTDQISPFWNIPKGEETLRAHIAQEEELKRLHAATAELNEQVYGTNKSVERTPQQYQLDIAALDAKAKQMAAANGGKQDVETSFSYTVDNRNGPAHSAVTTNESNEPMPADVLAEYRAQYAADPQHHAVQQIRQVKYETDAQGHLEPEKLVVWQITDTDAQAREAMQRQAASASLSPAEKARQQAMAAMQGSQQKFTYQDADHSKMQYVPPANTSQIQAHR